MKILDIFKILKEYGFKWCIYRFCYAIKIKILRKFKSAWKFFEHKTNIKRIDILNVNIENLEKFYSNLSETKKEEIVCNANDCLSGKIQAFSSIKLDYNNPIQWNFDPITKKYISSEKMWFEIDDFNKEISDIKIVWEPSRFCHLYLLTRAYMITKDVKYYEGFSQQIQQWNKNNTYPYGVNFKCGQECAIRMINILFNYAAFEKYGLVTEQDKKNVIEIVDKSYKKLLSNFFYAEKCIKNNHTFSELIGLIIGAWCEKNEKRQKKYYKKLVKQIKLQFLNDGGYIQYSFNYQRLVLQLLEILLKIEKKINIKVDNSTKEQILRSAMFMYNLQDECGDMPNYGSNDGAWIIPMASSDYRNFSQTINNLYIMIKGKKIYDDDIYAEEALWFNETLNYEKVEKANIKRESAQFNESGLFTIRSKDIYLMIVCNSFLGRPSQMDEMHIDLWCDGKNLFCDSGNYSYAKGFDRYYTMTNNHNTVKVDNLEQMKKRKEFLLYDWPICKYKYANSNKFEGTIKFKNGYSHTRIVKNINNKFEINDIVLAKKQMNKCYLNFNTLYDVLIEKNSFKVIVDNIICEVKFSDDVIIRMEESNVSLYYYNKVKSNRIVIEKGINNNKCSFTYNIEIFKS